MHPKELQALESSGARVLKQYLLLVRGRSQVMCSQQEYRDKQFATMTLHDNKPKVS